jgi:hypothetical protein
VVKTQTRNLAWGCDGVLEDGKQCEFTIPRMESDKAPGGWIEVYVRIVPQDSDAAKARNTQRVFHSKPCMMRYLDNRFKDPKPTAEGNVPDPADAEPVT